MLLVASIKNYKTLLFVTDLVNQLVQVLKRELAQLRESVQELDKVRGLDLVEPWDKG